jgi:hypothetical protein
MRAPLWYGSRRLVGPLPPPASPCPAFLLLAFQWEAVHTAVRTYRAGVVRVSEAHMVGGGQQQGSACSVVHRMTDHKEELRARHGVTLRW